MFAAVRNVSSTFCRSLSAVSTRSFGVSFTFKSFVNDYDVEEVKVTAEEGKNLLEVAQDNGVSINSFCGGNCHCGGCHVKFAQSIIDRIPKPTEKETEVLKKCVDYDDSSRLACQTKVDKCMEGKVIVVPLAI